MSKILSTMYGLTSKEVKAAERISKILTEDMMLDLDRVGFHLVRNHAPIVYHRLEAMALTAAEEYDKLIDDMKGAPRYERRVF
jgi:hypothetical protein